MDFEYSAKTKRYLEPLTGFMAEHVYPAEEVFERQLELLLRLGFHFVSAEEALRSRLVRSVHAPEELFVISFTLNILCQLRVPWRRDPPLVKIIISCCCREARSTEVQHPSRADRQPSSRTFRCHGWCSRRVRSTWRNHAETV